jgi:hypothetical protein
MHPLVHLISTDSESVIVTLRVVAPDKETSRRTSSLLSARTSHVIAPRIIKIKKPLGPTGIGFLLTGNRPVTVSVVDPGLSVCARSCLTLQTALRTVLAHVQEIRYSRLVMLLILST